MTFHFSRITAFVVLYLYAFAAFPPSVSSAQSATQPTIAVAKYDAREKPPEETESRSIGTSKKEIVLVARGFDQAILQQAYSGLLDLRDAGVPSSYVIAASTAANPNAIEFQFYSAGMKFGSPIIYQIGNAPMERIRRDIGKTGDGAQTQMKSYLQQKSDPNFIDTRSVPNRQGKSLIVSNYIDNVVIAVFGGDFQFQNRIYLSLLRGGKLPARWKFIWVSPDKFPDDQAILGLYAGGKNVTFKRWPTSEYDKASLLAKEAATYLDDWYYKKISPKIKLSQGYFFMEGMIISEKAMDAAVDSVIN